MEDWNHHPTSLPPDFKAKVARLPPIGGNDDCAFGKIGLEGGGAGVGVIADYGCTNNDKTVSEC